MTTLICAPIMVDETSSALERAARARELGAHIVEFRVDQVFSGAGDTSGAERVMFHVERSPLPCIVTCRSAHEGGAYDGDDDARIALYEKLGTMGNPPKYLDLELSTYLRSANLRQKVHLAIDHPNKSREHAPGLILSVHDFEGRPKDLFKKLQELRAQKAATIHKIVFRARSVRDNLELFEILLDRDRPTIALGMGEDGLMSRVLAPKFGGFLTFASVEYGKETAPGQPTIRELRETYRFDSIGKRTKVYGLFGDPVGHSIGPEVHNAAFEAAGHDGVYLPMRIAKEAAYEGFKATVLELLGATWLDFAGASVTIPHKGHLVQLAEADTTRTWVIDEAVRLCGAANTMTVRDDGSVLVMNTDMPAIVALVRAQLGDDLGGAHVGVLGAGGVARAAAAGLAHAGARVTIFARDVAKGEAMAKDIGLPNIAVRLWDGRLTAKSDCWVNATPLGMAGGPGPSEMPIDPREMETDVGGKSVVFDTVYRPLATPLVAAAREAGWGVIDGAALFAAQAAAQSRAWVGAGAPSSDFFARITHEALATLG
ncbi:MAG: type I 3-dehydroquinate dehydratase [Phycisphaerales bacterium]|nr:type I 3-dehydroquinate dehydratase [Phycisphaerales bacterium]